MAGCGLLRRQQLVAGRHAGRAAHPPADVLVDELEGHLRGRAEQLLDVLGIADAGQLDEDAVVAFALDGRLLGAGLVDAAADDLDRLVDRLLAALLGRLIG